MKESVRSFTYPFRSDSRRIRYLQDYGLDCVPLAATSPKRSCGSSGGKSECSFPIGFAHATNRHASTNSNSFDNNQLYELDQANTIMQHAEFRPDQKTALYVHGYVESMAVESIHVIVDAYQRRGDQNIIILDWGSLAEGNYLLDAVINAKQLGPRVAEVLIGMFAAGLPVERFHLVGHSLGGQLSGIVGRNVMAKSKGKYQLPRYVWGFWLICKYFLTHIYDIRRISALDPAFPPFYPSTGHISASDARMVDVIHTDAWLYGAPVSTGSIDFWPNSGKSLQPGCPRRSFQMLSDNGNTAYQQN